MFAIIMTLQMGGCPDGCDDWFKICLLLWLLQAIQTVLGQKASFLWH